MLERMCCVCRTRKPVTELLRVYREKSPDGTFSYHIDPAGNRNGRGARVCPCCVEKCVKTRALNRAFKTNLPNELYDELHKNVTVLLKS
jgi:predicted RNA-binding protein YlxR (DUF448 family)